MNLWNEDEVISSKIFSTKWFLHLLKDEYIFETSEVKKPII